MPINRCDFEQLNAKSSKTQKRKAYKFINDDDDDGEEEDVQWFSGDGGARLIGLLI